MRLSIRWKWMAAHLLIGTVIFIFMLSYLSSRLEQHFQNSFENRWKRELDIVGEYFHHLLKYHPTPLQTDSLASQVGKALGMRVTVIDTDGRVLADSDIDFGRLGAVENHSDRPEVQSARKDGFGRAYRFSKTVNRHFIYLATSLFSGREQKIVRIAVSSDEIEAALDEIRRLLWFAAALGVGLIVITGFLVSRPMTRNMNVMVSAAKTYARGDFSRRIPPRSNDELSELGNALNQMANDLKHHIERTRRERDQLEAILDSMVEGVVVIGLDGRILLSNRSFQSILNLKKPIRNRAFNEIIRDAEVLEAIERVEREKKDVVVVLELATVKRKVLEAHVAILGPQDEPSGTVAVFHDITQLKYLEKVRRDFVANVSHELRTPLTSIKGYVETLLESGNLEFDRAREFLETIGRHSDRMAKLVEDLLNLSKLESVESESALEVINLTEIMPQIVSAFSNLIEKHGMQVRLDLPSDLPHVTCFLPELETVLENLIDNAIKYGRDGKEIIITATPTAEEIQVSVADKGIGLPVEDQPRIFERFYRADKGRSRSLGGTGLGLSIVKHSVQRWGGRIWVESELGKGATFCFTLPRV